MGTITQAPWWLPAIIGAVSGGLMGAITSIVIGPTKAEREEKGKRRIEARKSLADAIKSFRYAASETRLKKYDLRVTNPAVDYSGIRAAALRLGSSIQRERHVLPPWERIVLNRRASDILGSNLLAWADLRPPSIEDPSEDSALLHAIATERQGPSKAAYSEWLLTQPPTSDAWDALLSSVDKLRKRYP